MPKDEIEIPFRWTCPKCKHAQTDTTNAEYGPFYSATCGQCGGWFDQFEMSLEDWNNFQEAVDKAEEMAAIS